MTTKTNFFTAIQNLLTRGLILTLTLKTEGDKLTVGVRPQRPDAEKLDDTLKMIPPMVLTHSAADLDEDFFETITQPLEAVDNLSDSVTAFMKNLENVKAGTKMAKGEKSQKIEIDKPVKTSKAKSKPKAKVAVKKSIKLLLDPDKPKALSKEAQAKLVNEEAKGLLESGLKLITEGKPGAALEELKRAKKLRASLAGIGDAIKKAEHAETMTKIPPMIVEMNTLLAGQNFEQGMKIYKQILIIDPKNTEAAQAYKDLSLKLGDKFVKNFVSNLKV